MALDAGTPDFESVGGTSLSSPSLSLQDHFGAVKGQEFKEGVTPSVEGPGRAPEQAAQIINIVQPDPTRTGKANGGAVVMTVHT